MREALETRDLLSVDVVVEGISVLDHEAEDGDHVLGQVAHRDEQRASRAVGAPGVVPFHVGLFGGDVEPALGKLADAATVGFQDGIEVGRTVRCLVDERGCVTGFEEIVPSSSVKKTSLVWKPAADGKVRPARGSGVVGEVGCVAGVARDHVVPAGIAGSSREYQHLLQVAQGQRLMPGGELQRAIGYGCAQREPAGSPSVECFDQRELQDVLQAGRVCSGLHARLLLLSR